MREEAVVVATRAELAERDVPDADGARMLCDEGAQVDGRRSIGRATRQPRVHLGAHLVAPAADGGAAVEAKVIGAEAEGVQLGDGYFDDPRFRAAPAGMKHSRRSAR